MLFTGEQLKGHKIIYDIERNLISIELPNIKGDTIKAQSVNPRSTNMKILNAISDLQEYCKTDTAKRSIIIQKLEKIKGDCNANLSFD